MRAIISSVDKKRKLFYVFINRKKTPFYLSNRLNKVFGNYIDKGILVDFEVSGTRMVDRFIAYTVNHFNLIKIPRLDKVIYDINQLRQEMKDVISKYDYFLSLDLEMTLAEYRVKNTIPEIIEVGYVLSNKQKEVIIKEGYYVFTHSKTLNKRTQKFLDIDIEKYNSEAIDYSVFYSKLEKIISKYNPQVIVWGKNDIMALNFSYKLNNKKELIGQKKYTDLLKLHKDYFNLSNDLGLFTAYKTYYGNAEKQTHSAYHDALVTKEVFDAFIDQMNLDDK